MSAKRRLALLIGICTLLLVAFLGMGVAQASAATVSGTLTNATTHDPIANGAVRPYDTAGYYTSRSRVIPPAWGPRRSR